MKLYVARHGEALYSREYSEPPLSPQGRSEIAQVAAFLEGAGVKVGQVLHSGKRRAAETAELFAPSVLNEGEPEATTGLKPNDSIEDFAMRLEPLTEDLMVVGHLPFMSDLVARLAGGTGVRFDPGTVVCLDRIETDRWRIAWMVGPRQMPD